MVTKPQDHKSKQDTNAEKQLRFEEVEGHELLKPFSKVKGSDQLRLMSQLRALGLLDDKDDKQGKKGGESDEVKPDDLDLEKVADLIDYVSAKFADDPEKFDEFTAGKGGYERALNLAMAYAGELGNDGASENS